MKVAIVQEHIDTRRGGAETSTVEMAQQLAALGLDVTVVCLGSDEAARPANDEASCFHFVDVPGGSRVARAIHFVAEADRFCREEGFDVVHAVTPCFSCNVYQPRGGTYVEAVNRSVARTGPPLGRLIKRMGRRFNRRQRFLLLVERGILTDSRPPFVAAISDYVGRQVREAFPRYPLERLRMVFNSVAIEPLPVEEARTARATMRREIGVDDATPLVLFVAHNFKLKGLGELIRAMSGSDWILAVVGRDNPSRYRRLARRLGVIDRVRFLGAKDDIRAMYAAADVLAHPTWYDPCSRVVLEALSCGLPVATTCCNGAAEIMEADRHGVVIDSPRDTAALVAAIVECLRPETQAACAADAPRLRERLSMVRHARELQALYDAVLQSK
jgi:UDP-glucose:(heptosyl)LPS alpha-1,3-glucosyltransferase